VKGQVGFALVLGIGAAAVAPGSVVFDRVQSSVYTEMLHQANLAFDRKDYARAFELNRRAACAGDKTSQAILGQMYLHGQGAPRDDITGYAWIRLAADFGFPNFTSLARKLEAALSPEQRAQGNARADALRASYGPAVTNMSCHAESRHGAIVIDSVVCSPDSAGGGEVLLRRCIDEAAE
jgi:hypothetical protein